MCGVDTVDLLGNPHRFYSPFAGFISNTVEVSYQSDELTYSSIYGCTTCHLRRKSKRPFYTICEWRTNLGLVRSPKMTAAVVSSIQKEFGELEMSKKAIKNRLKYLGITKDALLANNALPGKVRQLQISV